MTRSMYSPFPGRSPREAAQCKLPLCPPPRPSRRRKFAHQGNKQMKRQRKDAPVPYSSPADARKCGVGRNSGSSSAPNASASALLSSSRSLLSRSSHSDASLPASASAAGTTLPTSVDMRNRSSAWLHLWSAKSSCALHRRLPLPVSLYTSSQSVLCCSFHLGQLLRR